MLPMLNIMYCLEGWCEQPSLVYRSLTLPAEFPQAVFNIIELPTISGPEPGIHMSTFVLHSAEEKIHTFHHVSPPLPQERFFSLEKISSGKKIWPSRGSVSRGLYAHSMNNTQEIKLMHLTQGVFLPPTPESPS